MRYTMVRVSWGLALLVCTFGLAGPVAASDAQVGDTVEQVLDKMGRPMGEADRGELLLLQYDRGTVEIYEGYAVRVDLISPEQLRAQREKAEREMARYKKAMEAQRAQQIAEGRKELARIAADKDFAEEPVADQVAYWETFKRKYPGVPLPEAYSIARDALAKEEAAALKKKQEEEAALAAQPPPPDYSSSKRRKMARRVLPGTTVETPPYLVDYRKVGGNLEPSRGRR